VKDATLGSAGVSPADMSKWTTKGHACHIDMSLSQMGPWRPTPALSGYQTPIAGLWQVSAGSHPLPSVNGWAGRTAARTLLARDAGPIWKRRRTTSPSPGVRPSAPPEPTRAPPRSPERVPAQTVP
jgi:hypothetical protein